MTIKLSDLFGTSDPKETASQFEAFKAALNDSAAKKNSLEKAGATWQPPHEGGAGVVEAPTSEGARALATLAKSVSPEVLASLQTELETAGMLNKDISLTSPLASGFVPYDLEAPAKFLAPVQTPLRNRLPRTRGQGTVKRFKRITGISGSGTGGVANLSPFINDSSTASFGSLTLRRGPKISYAADDQTVNYKQMGLSDLVTWSAEFSGLGFQDTRQLSQTALLYSTMLAEERALLGGRGTDSGFSGALGTPTAANVTLTARAAGTGETGNSANIATLYVRVSAEGMFGESIASSEITSTALAAVTGRVVDVTMSGAGVTGAFGYRIYVGTATGITNQYYIGRTGCWGGAAGAGTASFTIQFTGAGTGGAPNSGANGSASETASSADAYDGLFSICTDPTRAGLIYSVGSKLSTSNIGVEFQNVFAGLWQGANGTGYTGTLASATSQGTKARPGRIVMSGADRKQLSALFLSGGSGNPTFFMNVPSGDSANMRMGQVVTAILNEVTGDTVDIEVHPWLAQGNAMVLSESLPVPDSQVPAPFAVSMVQDYMAIDWPVIQHTYDTSTYMYGALIPYAPVFSGAITNILAG